MKRETPGGRASGAAFGWQGRWRACAERDARGLGLGRTGRATREGIVRAAPLDSGQRNPGPRNGVAGVAPGSSRQRGFTLLEVIVAFAVLALALVLLLGTLSGSAREVRLSADAGRAALHAQSLLDQVGVGEALRPGVRDGEFEDGRYRWNLRIDPYVDPSRRAPDTIDPAAARLLLLALDVEWGDGGPRQRLQLQTLRLAQPDALGGQR